jgi:hypothetical protein
MRPHVTTADGRSPGLRVLALRRLPSRPKASSGFSGARLAAYSCGGSRSFGLAPSLRSLLIPEGNHRGDCDAIAKLASMPPLCAHRSLDWEFFSVRKRGMTSSPVARADRRLSRADSGRDARQRVRCAGSGRSSRKRCDESPTGCGERVAITVEVADARRRQSCPKLELPPETTAIPRRASATLRVLVAGNYQSQCGGAPNAGELKVLAGSGAYVCTGSSKPRS